MTDEPRELPLTDQAGSYALLPEAPMDIEYASDDSDSGTAIPSIRDPRAVQSAISKPNSRIRASIPGGPQGGKFFPNAFIIGDDVVDAAPADLPADSEDDEEDDDEIWQPFGTAAGHHSPPRVYEEWAYIGPYAEQYPTLLGGGAGTDQQTGIPHLNQANIGPYAHQFPTLLHGPAPVPQLGTAFESYEAHLQATVSAEVDAKHLNLIRFDTFQLTCVDEASYLSQKHKMLIQRSFALPGFRFEGTWRQVYVDDLGHRHPFVVIIPYERRRLWVSLLATNTAVSGADPLPQTVAIYQLARIFQAALDGFQHGKCSVRSRPFARLVSHRLKEVDPAFRDFNVTADIKWVLQYFTAARHMYRAKGPLYPRYMKDHLETVRVAAVGLEALADKFLKLWQADVDEGIDGVILLNPAVEKEYCPETDTEEAAATFQARSKRPQVAPREVRPGKLPWLGYGPDPHDDSDSDF